MNKFERKVDDQLLQMEYDPDSVKEKSKAMLKSYRKAKERFMRSENSPILASLKNPKSLERHKDTVQNAETDFWCLSVVNDTMQLLLTYPTKNKEELKSIYKILDLYYINKDEITHEKIKDIVDSSLLPKQYFALLKKALLLFTLIFWKYTINYYRENKIILTYSIKYKTISSTEEYYDHEWTLSDKKNEYKINKYKEDINAIGIDPMFAMHTCLYILESYQRFCWEIKNLNITNLINKMSVSNNNEFTGNAQNLLDSRWCIVLAQDTMNSIKNEFLSLQNYKKYYNILTKKYFSEEYSLQKWNQQDLNYEAQSSYFDHDKKALWAFTWVFWCNTLYKYDLNNILFYISVEIDGERNYFTAYQKNLEYEDTDESIYK